MKKGDLSKRLLCRRCGPRTGLQKGESYQEPKKKYVSSPFERRRLIVREPEHGALEKSETSRTLKQCSTRSQGSENTRTRRAAGLEHSGPFHHRCMRRPRKGLLVILSTKGTWITVQHQIKPKYSLRGWTLVYNLYVSTSWI